MKTVTLHIDQKVIADMKKFYFLQHLCQSAKSVGDEAWLKILKDMEHDKDDITLKYKDKNAY